MSLNGLIARNAAFLMLGQALSWSLGLAFIWLVPRSVGAAAWGEWSLAGAITAVVTSLAGLGLGTLLIKDVSREPARAGEYVSAALATQLMMSAPFAVIVGTFALVAHYPVHTRIVIAIVTAAALITFLTTPVTAALIGLQKMHLNSLGTLITSGLVSLAAILLVKLAAVGIIAISLAAVAGATAAAAVQIVGLRRYARFSLKFNWPLIRHLVVGGLPYWSSGLFLSIYVWIDAVMLSLMTSNTEVGWYGAATKLISTLGFLPYIITMAFFPAISHGYRHDRAAMGRLAQVSLRLLVSLGLPVVVGTAVVGPQIARLMYGWAFAPAGQILVVLSLTLLPMFVATLVNSFLIAADRQLVWTWVMGASCVLNPAINLVSISFFERAYHNGALGASYALLITDTLIGIAALVLLPKELWASVRAIVPAVGRAAAAAGLMGVLVWLLRDRSIIVQIATGVISFSVAALVLMVFTPDDLSAARGLFRRFGARLGRVRPVSAPASESTVLSASTPLTEARLATASDEVA